MESGFNPEILEHIRTRLGEGADETTITNELMRTDNPTFIPINGDFGLAISYIAYAKKVV